MKSKEELRNKILKKRARLSAEDVRRRSKRICELVRGMEAYEKAADICLYMPVRNEVDVTYLADAARNDGKRLWIPRVEGRKMNFYRWDEDTKLTKGVFGISEPAAERPLPREAEALVVMPGAVFSRERDRIGYGGGYYDAFIAGREKCHTVAVCYDFQIVDRIPREAHDVRPDAVVSDVMVIK